MTCSHRARIRFFALAFAASMPATAQIPKEVLPAFKADQVFEEGASIEHISLFSGDVQLSVPIGPSYTLSGTTTYRLTANYSTRLWNLYSDSNPCGDTTCVDNPTARHARVAGNSALGVGWSLTPGYITGTVYSAPDGLTAPRYHAPDGSVHALGQQGAFYVSDDGFFARFYRETSPDRWRMELPDGQRWYFETVFVPPSLANGFDFFDGPYTAGETKHYGLTRIEDPFSQPVLTVSYRTNPGESWMVDKITMGTREIRFAWTTFTTSLGHAFQVIDTISFPILGASPNEQRLFVGFQRGDGDLHRARFDSPTCTATPAPAVTRVPHLTGISAADQSYTFEYGSPLSGVNEGIVTALRLPTGGRLQYEFLDNGLRERPCARGISSGCMGSILDYDPPRPQLREGEPQVLPILCGHFFTFQSLLDTAPVLSKRTEFDPITGVNTVSTYRRFNIYEPAGFPAMDTPDFDRVLRVLVVERPDGNGGINATKHFFSVGTTGGPTGLEVGRRYYAGTNVSVPALREEIICHETWGPPVEVCGPLGSDGKIGRVGAALNRRQHRDVTWYGDHASSTPGDGGTCNDTTGATVPCWQRARSGFVADAQEYATETVSAPTMSPSAIFLGNGQTARQTTTGWTPNLGVGRWLPKLFSSRTVQDLYAGGSCPLAPCIVTTLYQFDTSSGVLLSSSVTDGSSFKWRQESFGYVGGNPVTQTLTGSEVPGSFTTTRTFDGGLVKTSRRTAPTNVGWNSFDVIRDPQLGLITTSFDPNGIPTTYGYDLLGRLTSINPSSPEAGSIFCYVPSVGSMPAYVITKRGSSLSCSANGQAPAEGSGVASAFFFDGLGRVTREVRLLPNETATGTYLAVKHTNRTSGGFVTSESEWTPCGSGTNLLSLGCYNALPSNATSFGNFDVFGRPRSIALADGTSIFKAYDDGTECWQPSWTCQALNSDFREDTFTFNVAGDATTRSIRKDILGRVLVVSEPKMLADPDGLGPLNLYGYNVLDKLALVQSSRKSDATTSVGQTRTFTYDALGYLRSESHPEKGTTTYSDYTPLGDPTTTTEGSPLITRKTTFDSLGRVTRISDATSSPETTYLENWYDGTDGGGHTNPLGKLTKSIGYNPGAFENARVEESYDYLGLNGRLSSKSTTVRRGTTGNPILQSVTEGFTWNTLGLLAKHDLPGPQGNPPLSIETFYTAGMPTRVFAGGMNVASGVTYHPHGGLKSYTTANGVTTTLDMPSNRMARVARVSTTGAATNFDSGTFAYDGAGNVTEMRLSPSVADVFTYDRLSRLKTSTFGTVAGSPTESFFYDGHQEKGFGNLVSRVYQGGTTDLPANMATNRLSTASYDSRGLMTVYASDGFTYDARNRRTRYAFNSQETETYLYAPNDERVVKRVATSSLPTADPGSLRYFPVTPCRILDTRNAVGTYGGPSLTGQQERSFPTVGTCGIPSKASALALTVTAVPKAGSTLTNGSLGAWRSDLGYRPNTLAAVVNPARTRATLAIIGLSGTGAFKLFPDIPASEAVDAVVDVSGYFAPPVAAPSSGKSWLITYRDAQNHPVAEYRVDEDRSGVVLPQRFHVYLGNTLVATREEAFNPGYGGLWSFFSSDHLGTPRLRTGVLGPGQSVAPVLETYRYRAFGAKFPGLVQPDRDGHEFALMERDVASGNHYVHARFFSDYPARFLSPDQVNGLPEDPQSWNRYTYVANNPLKYVDPDGQSLLPSESERKAALERQKDRVELEQAKKEFRWLASGSILRANWSDSMYWHDVVDSALGVGVKWAGYIASDPALAAFPTPFALEASGPAAARASAAGLRTIVEEAAVTKVADRLPATLAKAYERAKDVLARGVAGLHQHELKGALRGKKAIDLRGSGQGRGVLRVIYTEEADGRVVIHQITDYH